MWHGGRHCEGRGGPALSGWLMRCVVKWREVSSRLMWVREKIVRESWVFISVYGLGSEKSEEEIEEFWNELSECVGSFDRRVGGSAFGFECQSGK